MASQEIDTNTGKSQPTIKRPIRAACFMFLILFAVVGPCVLFLPGIDRPRAVLWGTGYCLFLSVVSVGAALAGKRAVKCIPILSLFVFLVEVALALLIRALTPDAMDTFMTFVRVMYWCIIAALTTFLIVSIYGWVTWFRRHVVQPNECETLELNQEGGRFGDDA